MCHKRHQTITLPTTVGKGRRDGTTKKEFCGRDTSLVTGPWRCTVPTFPSCLLQVWNDEWTVNKSSASEETRHGSQPVTAVTPRVRSRDRTVSYCPYVTLSVVIGETGISFACRGLFRLSVPCVPGKLPDVPRVVPTPIWSHCVAPLYSGLSVQSTTSGTNGPNQ